MCDCWKTQGEQLTSGRIVDTLKDLREWMGPSFFVHFAGGEPLIFDGIFDAFRYCSSQGIVCGANTNGLALNGETCKQVVDSGLTYLNVSLDSHLPEVHDRHRGVPGTFDRAIAGLARLRANGHLILGINSVLMRDNVAHIKEMTERFLALGIDRLTFQPIRPLLDVPVEHWPNYEHWIHDLGALRQGIRYLKRRRRSDPRILTTGKELRSMLAYFEDPRSIIPTRPCTLGYERVIIMHNGDIRLCGAPFPPVGNIRIHRVADVWGTESARACRAAMRSCVSPCVKDTNRRLSLTERVRKFMFFARKGCWRVNPL
jgi:MoaA/NifB/PqqE/SkfB family radical SAM enzyme